MANWDNIEKSGIGQPYDDPNLLYDSPSDPDGGNLVYYNGTGTVTTFINVTKSS